ncbi:hypothetical protein GQ53DRAFT_805355 [Thozetella sp. PMI_491]|nr:hypothetical protein GQ53DRAFT_805355 [Thozetella sp. PMI_491]
MSSFTLSCQTIAAGTRAKFQFATSSRVDAVICIGGGSSLVLGKAIGTRTGLYHIAIHTTHAVREVMSIFDLAPSLRRRLHPELLRGFSATSGVNSIARATNALCARNGTPIISLFAQEGTRVFVTSLLAVARDPK